MTAVTAETPDLLFTIFVTEQQTDLGALINDGGLSYKVHLEGYFSSSSLVADPEKVAKCL